MEKDGDRRKGKQVNGRVKEFFFDKGLSIQSMEPFSTLALLETPHIPTRDELTLLPAATRLSSWPWRGHTNISAGRIKQ